MEAPTLGRSFTVDWDDAQEDARSWDEIIESQQHHVSIPQRLVLPCGMPAWESGDLELLRKHAGDAPADLVIRNARLFSVIDGSETGELDSVASADFKPVVDACTLCDIKRNGK